MSRILHSQRPSGSLETVSLPSNAPNTLLVDGNYLLKCSYHATIKSPEYIVNGRHMGTLSEFIRKLRELIAQFNITKCVVMWDGEHGGKLRHNLYPYYKANRANKSWYRGASKSQAQADEDERTQRSIEAQKVRIQTYLEELFVRQTEQSLMEGDDLIAYYCQSYHEYERITIFTNDRDMCQLLVLNGVNIFLNNVRLLINRDNFDVEFPYHYRNAALVKVMCGDTSDNIKGVSGLGLKTLLAEFPQVRTRAVTVEEIVECARAHCAARLAAKPVQKPLVVMQNIIDGVAMRLHHGNEALYAFGNELYRLNEQLMDLSQPMLTREAREEVLHIGNQVLNPAERGARNLMPMMREDYLLPRYRGDINYFAEPWLRMIVREKALFTQNANS
jgi:5'-3' exonuclease